MPRTKRTIPYGLPVHIICRGNNRQKVFHNDNDKLRYYTLLREFKKENELDVFHYCLMDTHVHIIIQLNLESNLSKFMKQVNLTYVHYYCKMYSYLGHFWQDRFKSYNIETEVYLLQCGKYIELNPVRAGIVEYPGGYKFSSYNFYAQGKPDGLITPSPAYKGLADIEAIRQKQYIDFVVDSSIINNTRQKKRGRPVKLNK